MSRELEYLSKVQSFLKVEKEKPINLFEDLLKGVTKKKTERKAPNSFITEQIELTANLLGKPYKQVAGLTRDWSFQELYDTRKKAESFTKNPPALWWKLYKERKSK